MTDVAAPSTAAPATEEDVTTTLYRAAIGPVSTGYYLPIFTRFEAADHAGISWNHAASLSTLNWLIFRQLWSAAVGYAAIVLAITLLVFGIGRLVLDFSDSLMMVLGLGFGLAAFVLPGLFGNALLHSECRKRMSKALAAHANVADACTQLTVRASTRRRMIWLAAVNAAVALVALVVYLQFSVAATPTVAGEGGHVVTGHTVDMAASAPDVSAASAPASAAPASYLSCVGCVGCVTISIRAFRASISGFSTSDGSGIGPCKHRIDFRICSRIGRVNCNACFRAGVVHQRRLGTLQCNGCNSIRATAHDASANTAIGPHSGQHSRPCGGKPQAR